MHRRRGMVKVLIVYHTRTLSLAKKFSELENIEIDLAELEEKAGECNERIRSLEEFEKKIQLKSIDDLRYIG